MQVLTEQQQRTQNFYTDDTTLQQILQDMLSEPFYHYANKELTTFGEHVATVIDARAKVTDREGEPRLQRYDEYGEEVSQVIVNEGYKNTVKETYETGIVGYVHKKIPELNQKGNYVYSFAQGYVLSQAEPGFYCPVTLTMATAYLLDHFAEEDVKQRFLPHVAATGDVELFEGATFLTERQGGSDVGANIVRAVKDGKHYLIFGEKYFASNAGMCGVAMVLARMEDAPGGSKGLTLFAVPWKREDGTLNGITIRRLKDKLGVRAVPSGEVVFDGAQAFIVGDPSKGIYYMLEALNLSRVCNAAASLGIMKRALDEATTYASARHAFGRRLLDYPMVQQTIGTLKAKHHASLVTLFDLVQLYDDVSAGRVGQEQQLNVRLLIAIVKKETAEQAIHFAHEAIEMHGGNGYIEDFVTPRLLRDAQVLTVWEGTANILAHELIRIIKQDGHQLLLALLEQRLASLRGSEVQLVKVKLQEITSQLEQFIKLPAPVQTLEAKGLMKKISDLYESVVVLEHAEKHGMREQQLAQVYIQETWKTVAFGEVPLAVQYS